MKVKSLVAAAVLASSSVAAYAVECTGPLPNARWSWGAPVLVSTTTTFGEISYAGNSGNGSADVTTTATYVCPAINPGGQVNADHSTTTTDSSTVNQRVCFNSPNQTDIAPDCR